MYLIEINGKKHYARRILYCKWINDSYYPVPKEDAEGIFYDGAIYSLTDRAPIEGKPYAAITEIDNSFAIHNVLSEVDNTNDGLCELSEVLSDIDLIMDAICELSMEVN